MALWLTETRGQAVRVPAHYSGIVTNFSLGTLSTLPEAFFIPAHNTVRSVHTHTDAGCSGIRAQRSAGCNRKVQVRLLCMP